MVPTAPIFVQIRVVRGQLRPNLGRPTASDLGPGPPSPSSTVNRTSRKLGPPQTCPAFLSKCLQMALWHGRRSVFHPQGGGQLRALGVHQPRSQNVRAAGAPHAPAPPRRLTQRPTAVGSGPRTDTKTCSVRGSRVARNPISGMISNNIGERVSCLKCAWIIQLLTSFDRDNIHAGFLWRAVGLFSRHGA